MIATKQDQISATIHDLYCDSKNDRFKMMKGVSKSIFRPIQPSDFKEVYLSISKEQGEDLKRLIVDNNVKSVVEFGTSFGISTLFLAQGIVLTGGRIITTELILSKAKQAIINFERAGVSDLIEVKIGDAMETLKNHNEPIDLLLLDGWKDLYLPLFRMLSPNFKPTTFIYVDNADMAETQSFLNTIGLDSTYHVQFVHHGKAAVITRKVR